MFLIDDIAKWFTGTGGDVPEEGWLDRQGAHVIAALPFPLAVCNRQLAVLGVNRAFCRLFKVPVDQIKGKALPQILGGDVRVVDEGGRERQIGTLPGIAGEKGPKLLVGNFPKLGRRVFRLFTGAVRGGILLTFRDVTEENDLREKIERSRHELLSVFDGIEDPMVMIDRDFRIRRINEAMRKALGGSSWQGFIGKSCYWKLHGLRERCSECTAAKTFATGEKASRLGLLERRSRPDEFSYQITSYPLKDSSGKVGCLAECYRDVTDVRRIEEELYESERSRVMEPLAAGIAHEVRNPLAIIRSTAQYCLGEVGQNGELRESLQTIVRNTEHANRVIGNFLDFARPREADFKTQSLGPILQKGLGLVKARADSQQVRIVRKIPKNLPPLFLDGNRLLQAIVNFLVNSLDAMPRGGRIEIEANRRDGNKRVEMVIRDTGEGIPEELLPKILQPFYSTKKDGVGLGLPIAEGIVRSHGGRVEFKSWKGKGTEVRIELPTRKK